MRQPAPLPLDSASCLRTVNTVSLFVCLYTLLHCCNTIRHCETKNLSNLLSVADCSNNRTLFIGDKISIRVRAWLPAGRWGVVRRCSASGARATPREHCVRTHAVCIPRACMVRASVHHARMYDVCTYCTVLYCKCARARRACVRLHAWLDRDAWVARHRANLSETFAKILPQKIFSHTVQKHHHMRFRKPSESMDQ